MSILGEIPQKPQSCGPSAGIVPKVIQKKKDKLLVTDKVERFYCWQSNGEIVNRVRLWWSLQTAMVGCETCQIKLLPKPAKKTKQNKKQPSAQFFAFRSMTKLPLLINCRYCSIHGAAVIVCTGSHQLNPGRTHMLSFQRDRSLYQHLQEFVLKIVVEFTAVFMWSVTRVWHRCAIFPLVWEAFEYKVGEMLFVSPGLIL